MAENKTKPTGANVDDYIASRANAQQAAQSKLGKHKMGKSCLYFRQLADLDLAVLEQLITGSIAEVKKRYS